MAREYRVGIGHDTHRLVPERPLILAGVRVDHHLGLAGHSDADVVLHAVTDALLGATGKGDIGEHYPDTDPANKDIDSSVLLRDVVELIGREGWTVVNADVIVHAQAPKLLPHKTTMKNNLATLLKVEPGLINVKAKTGEKVGPVGRQEAMQAEAVILVERDRPESA